MASLLKLTGVKKAIKALRREKIQRGRLLAAGLKRAGLFLQRESQKVVPVEWSTLKNSAFTRAFGTGAKTEVIVGYTAGYAVYVHEDLQARHNPGQQAKFLEGPAREKEDQIRRIITGAVKG